MQNIWIPVPNIFTAMEATALPTFLPSHALQGDPDSTTYKLFTKWL